MTAPAPASRPFEPGTTGWSVADLSNVEIEEAWFSGAYEIVEGVLTIMPPASYGGGVALAEIIHVVNRHLDAVGQEGDFGCGVDTVISPLRVVRPDGVFLTAEDKRRQKQANAEKGIENLAYGRILVPPTLIIESVSFGYESHDRRLKRCWYSEWQVPNYWILDAYKHTLECLVLSGDEYKTDQSGRDKDELRPAMFPGLVIPLGQLWVE